MPFLKNLAFDHSERQELANLFRVETFQGMQTVMNVDDYGDKFYIIIQGVISIKIKNKNILERRFKQREYDNLKKWKAEVFDPKVKKHKEEFFENY